MSNPSMEAKVKELMELKRMKEELEAEIAATEDSRNLLGKSYRRSICILRKSGRKICHGNAA